MNSPAPLKRLTKRAEFLRVRGGFRAGRPNLLVEARRRSDNGLIGVGFTASRKVGGAVIRNRAKRRLREAARQVLPALGKPGVDYVLVARQSTPDADWVALLDDLRSALIRLAAQLDEGAEPQGAQPRRGPPRRPPTESD